MIHRPTFSVLHATARTLGWREVRTAWSNNADGSDWEYILSVDSRFGKFDAVNSGNRHFRVVENEGRKTCVDNWNNAAKDATGKVLILIGDDNFPCAHWDTELKKVLPENLDSEFVIQVATGNPRVSSDNDLITQIQSRKRYERLGYMLCPEYDSMYADDEFAAHARMDGCVIDARHLMFPEKHPVLGNAEMDDIYRWQNRPENYSRGRAIFERRRATGFGTRATRPVGGVDRSIALCIPGETFSGKVFWSSLDLLGYLFTRGFCPIQCVPCRAATSPYVARHIIRDGALRLEPRPNYLLWIDDDQVLTPEVFEMLFSAIEALPEAGTMAAWTWLDDGESGQFRISGGIFDEKREHCIPIPNSQMEKVYQQAGVIEVKWHGFPCVLMRTQALIDAGEFPFAPEPDLKSRWGVSGEDISFCVHAAERGNVRMFIHPKAYIEHLKVRAIGPDPRRGEFGVKKREAVKELAAV